MSSTTNGSGFGTAEIVGIVIGGILGLATIIGLVFSFYAMCCKKNNQAQVWAQRAPYYPPSGAYGQPMNSSYYPQQPYNKEPMNNDLPPAYSAVHQGTNSYGKY